MVSVVPVYDTKNSFPSENRYVFKYYITITNLGDDRIKLQRRHWIIYDLAYGISEVEGEGVIGLNPVLESGENFTYFSNVVLRSGIGRMEGIYTFENLDSGDKLVADIPMFNLYTSVLEN